MQDKDKKYNNQTRNITTGQGTALVIPQLSDESPLRLQQVLSPVLRAELSLKARQLLLDRVDFSAGVALLL